MAGITLAQAQTHLDAWMAADLAVAKNQSYTIGARTYTRADAKEIAQNVERWQSWVNRLSSGRGGMRVTYAVTG